MRALFRRYITRGAALLLQLCFPAGVHADARLFELALDICITLV